MELFFPQGWMKLDANHNIFYKIIVHGTFLVE